MTVLDFYVPPPSVDVDVYSVCQRIEQWASSADDIGALKDNKSKLSAIDQYLAQTTREGRAVINATMRRLELRIGEVLGEVEQTWTGKPTTSLASEVVAASPDPLDRTERYNFRKMAAHPEVVEAVIANSTDVNPASRRQVLDAIKTAEEPVIDAIPAGLDTSRHAVEARVALARKMAADGHTSRQIATAIGITFASMAYFRSRHGVDVPADRIIGRRHVFDSTRVIAATVESVAHVDTGLDQVDYDDLDLTDVDYWLTTLSSAIKSLTTLRNKLKEISQ